LLSGADGGLCRTRKTTINANHDNITTTKVRVGQNSR
jgi:hypothetical protein